MFTQFKFFILNYLFKKKAYKFFIKDWIQLTDVKCAADVVSTMRFSYNLKPVELRFPRGKKILVIAPHPDDEIIGPGGTLIQAIREGATVQVLYLTLGKLEEQIQRKKEAESIAELMGYSTIFWDYLPRQIPITRSIFQRLAKIFNDFSPETVFLPFLLDDHDDHRRASQLLWEAQKAEFINSIFEIWAYQVYTSLPSNVIVDITSVAKEKEKYIKMWESQSKKRDWAHYALGLNAFNTRFLSSSSDLLYAETFFVLPVKEYLLLCAIYFGEDSSSCYYTKTYQNVLSDQCSDS